MSVGSVLLEHSADNRKTIRFIAGRIQAGAAGAGSPFPMGTRAPAPKAQGCPFPSPFDEYPSLGSIFAPKVLYWRLSNSEGALLIQKDDLFARECALLSRCGTPSPAEASFWQEKRPFPFDGAL